MTPFLHYVAADIISKYGTDLSRIAVVFPNKRASIFLNKELFSIARKPLWSPSYITIKELFSRNSDLQLADPLKLVSDLYKVYVKCTGSMEEFDRFFGWGQLLISDFDDIDKHLAIPSEVFFNLSASHEMDNVSYLSEEQKELLKGFFADFKDDQDSRLKQRFETFWNNIEQIYNNFKQSLADQHLAYEGQLYRRVTEGTTFNFHYDKYLFVGFNLMQEVEQKLVDRLREEGKAEFYWDYDKYLTTERNIDGLSYTPEGGHYVKSLLHKYHNALESEDENIYDDFHNEKSITFMSSPTEDIQARYVSQWLKENGRITPGERTAIVLANESLLPSVIHSLPDEVNDVNVTMGYPLNISPIVPLILQLFQYYLTPNPLQREQMRKRLLSHPYAIFFNADFLESMPKVNPVGANKGTDIGDLLNHVIDFLKTIGSNVKQAIKPKEPTNAIAEDEFFQESLFRTYKLFVRLKSLYDANDLPLNEVGSLVRLVRQLVSTTSVPVHGEPICDIQVMGLLETRNLDFEHVLLLSCNEGTLPKGMSDTSFIPYTVRKAFGLTTRDNMSELYAFYFYHLLQRCKDITVLYNSTATNGQKGEMSRFMLQMLVDKSLNIQLKQLSAPLSMPGSKPLAIEKTDNVLASLNSITSLSPTAINTYLRCPIRFYYRYIAHIEEPQRDDDYEIDNASFGTVFHRAAELIYRPYQESGKQLDESEMRKLIGDESLIEDNVDRAFYEEFFKPRKPNVNPNKLPYNGLQLINRQVIVKFIKQLLDTDSHLTPFRVLQLEYKVSTTVSLPSCNKSLTIGGYIDRIDSDGNNIRIVDYKTGSKEANDIASIDDIFNPKNVISKHADYFLQTFLYSLIVRQNTKNTLPVSPALLFIQHAKGDDYNPILHVGKEIVGDCEPYRKTFMDNLTSVLETIFNPDVPFERYSDKPCNTCPFKALCGY